MTHFLQPHTHTHRTHYLIPIINLNFTFLQKYADDYDGGEENGNLWIVAGKKRILQEYINLEWN